MSAERLTVASGLRFSAAAPLSTLTEPSSTLTSHRPPPSPVST